MLVILIHCNRSVKKHETLRVSLVIELKNYCLKRCEKYGLKSVIEKCVLVFIKQKKNVFGIMV